MSRVSIIIATYNRAKLLSRVLPTYVLQASVCEILIVDDGSRRPVEDALVDVLGADWLEEHGVRVISHERTLGLPAARNTGIRAAIGEFIFFGEDDAMLDEGHVQALIEERERLQADLICGRLIQQQDDETFEQAKQRTADTREQIFNRRIISVNTTSLTEATEVPFAHCLFLIPTELASEHLFNTRFGGPSFMREDAELPLRLRRRGHRLFATPEASVFHLAKAKGSGTGTRDYSSLLAQLGSIVANISMLIEEHYEEISPFFPGLTRRQMLQRACQGHLYLGLKNWARGSVGWFDRSATLWNRLRWLVQRKL